jgi:hypothetical protein
MGKKFETNEQVVVDRIRAGDKQREIADDLGVSRQWVALFAKRNGLNRSKAGRPSRYDNKKINELLSKGKTYAEIVDIVGAPSEDAVRAAQRYWKRKMN